MAIRTVVTEGFGNGTFNGTIALVVTQGYITVPLLYTRYLSDTHYTKLVDSNYGIITDTNLKIGVQ